MNFNFVKHRKKFFLLTIITFLIGFGSLFMQGLNLGIDFVSGTRVDVSHTETLSSEQLEKDFESIGGLKPSSITLAGDNNETGVIRFAEPLDKDQIASVKEYFKEKYEVDPNVSTVSPQVGRELAQNAFFGTLIASIGIIIYLSVRFEWLKGLATVVAMLHDAIFAIMVFSIFQLEVDITFIAALLTIVGYSVNDTIVTFDRIRENTKAVKNLETFEQITEIVNTSIKQTLVRSINTVITVLLAALALLIFGSEAIRTFSLALVIGLFAGTYSSLFIAAQLWAIWKFKQVEYRKKHPKVEEEDDEEEWV